MQHDSPPPPPQPPKSKDDADGAIDPADLPPLTADTIDEIGRAHV